MNLNLRELYKGFMDQEKIEILWQDEYIGIINKPAELIIHASAISSDSDTLISRLRDQFENPPIPVHRLDRPVSGVIVGAFDSDCAAQLSRSFREGEVHKNYIAIVRGHLKGEGHIDIPLKNEKNGEMQKSRTSFRHLAQIELPLPSRKYSTSRYSLVMASPETGRYHQIRRHLARMGYPIVGDTSHGDTYCNHHFEENFGVKGLMLHSYSVSLKHPYREEMIRVESPLRMDMRNICGQFHWSDAFPS